MGEMRPPSQPGMCLRIPGSSTPSSSSISALAPSSPSESPRKGRRLFSYAGCGSVTRPLPSSFAVAAARAASTASSTSAWPMSPSTPSSHTTQKRT
eukprot:scaffold101582_cov42-Phaeocystis_antarctica.AAC.1